MGCCEWFASWAARRAFGIGDQVSGTLDVVLCLIGRCVTVWDVLVDQRGVLARWEASGVWFFGLEYPSMGCCEWFASWTARWAFGFGDQVSGTLDVVLCLIGRCVTVWDVLVLQRGVLARWEASGVWF